jgi:hypothetical protein
MTEVLADHALARRLERAEGAAGAHFVEALARAVPQSGAQWIEVAGAYAMYAGSHSPVTQTFGLGLFQAPTVRDMERIEAFFRERGAPVHHEVSPLAGQALAAMLSERGYHPIEFSSVMFLPLGGDMPSPRGNTGSVTVRLIGEGEHDLWVHTATEGWRELTALSEGMADIMRILAARQGALAFVGELEGRPIATASLAIHDGVALFAGASTIPERRHRGAQGALLEQRLAYARRIGCDLAMMCAEPGSGSQRNAERQGFRIAYTRIKWGLGA